MTDVTLFHASVDPETRQVQWTAAAYPAASLRVELGASAAEEGLKSANAVTARIFTEDTLVISAGDRLARGRAEGNTPPDGAFTVLRYADNRRGSPGVRHWKVVCV